MEYWMLLVILAIIGFIAALVWKPSRMIVIAVAAVIALFMVYDAVTEEELDPSNFVVRSLNVRHDPTGVQTVRVSGEFINNHPEATIQNMDVTVVVYDCDGLIITERCDIIGYETKQVHTNAAPRQVGTIDNVYFYFETPALKNAQVNVTLDNAVGDWST